MQPLVSCILPTRNRAALIGVAIQSFLSQTYPNIELIIVDNGDDATAELIPDDARIFYTRVDGSQTTGDMRNHCNTLAHGEIICHFDSDDWSGRERVTQQVELMGERGILTGYCSMLFYDIRDGKCYRWAMETTRFAIGTSLCYRKAWWADHKFLALNVGEDYQFFQRTEHLARQQVYTCHGERMMVALVHDDQTSIKDVGSGRYQPVDSLDMPEAFFEI